MPDRALVNEGACSHHPADPGGATVKGITQRTAMPTCAAHRRCKSLGAQS
ncbi:glycosyl hydrolase 108 family protein [Mesorhizobium sp. M1D.F.Ca.ET.234.01.1.1]